MFRCDSRLRHPCGYDEKTQKKKKCWVSRPSSLGAHVFFFLVYQGGGDEAIVSPPAACECEGVATLSSAWFVNYLSCFSLGKIERSSLKGFGFGPPSIVPWRPANPSSPGFR